MNNQRSRSKKTIAVTVIISVFLIGIVSASLIDYFGKISGTATVTGPVFYANSYVDQQQTILDPVGNPVKVYLLSTEEEGNLKSFDYDDLDCTFPLGGCDARFMQFFTTKELGLNYFYDSNWEFHTNLKILEKTEGSGDCRAYVKLFRMYEEEEEGNYVELGETSLTDIIPQTTSYGDMISTLNLPYTEMIPEDRFYIEYWVKCDYGVYDLRFRIGDDKTRIEVSAAWNKKH